jgi:hypothetical protein
MKAKLPALVAMMLAFGAMEYRLVARPGAGADVQMTIARLMPAAIGNFQAVGISKDNPEPNVLEVTANYRDTNDVEATMYVRFGAHTEHNGIACWYVRGHPMMWEHLPTVTTRTASAVFDTALCEDEHGLALLAATECYPSGCREENIQFDAAASAPRLRISLPEYPAARASVVPISVVIRESKVPAGESLDARGAELVRSFESFAANLDLTSATAPQTVASRGPLP